MKANVNFSEIVNQLYKTFSNEAEASQYNNTQSGAQYMGLCGWAGVMSPLNRAAFLQEFGQDVTDRAEREARARVAEYRAAYEASEYHRHELEADTFAASYGDPQKSQIPAVGSFVFGWTDWLKCEGGPMDPLKNHVNDWGSLRPELVEIAAVVEVEPAEFLSAETAHRIAREHQNHGGSRYNEADPLRLDGDPYAWTVGVLVVCRAYGDGEKSQTPARWYVVDSEGYDWARYILMPQRFASMYAEEIADLRAQRAAVEAQKAAEEEAAKAARLADYRARCARWEGAGLVDVRPLIAAESAAYGTREKSQIRSASAKLLAARRKNIATFIAAAFPGVKFSIRANNGWGAAYRISWTDGPTVETFRASTDVDLLFTTGEYYSNQDDSYDYDRKEFIDFAEKFMGFTRGGFDCDRHESQEFRDEIAARIREAVPGLPESDQAQIPEADALEVAEAADIISGDRAHRSRVVDMAERWGLLDVVAYVARITDRPTTSEASTDPTPDNGGTGAAYGDSEKSQNQEAPDGLTLEEIPGGVAVVGDSRATYKARRDIKAHGARWNKAAQRWEATDPEAVESLRQWLAAAESAPVADATPTEEAAPVAYGDSQKSQKKPRMKSMHDINRQAAELCRYFYGHKDHPKMWKTIKGIEEVYCTNIAQAHGFAAFHSFTEYSCNSKVNVLEKCKADDIYNARETSEVYARPFDWDKVRQATTAEEVTALSWSLHWMGYEIDLDATSLEERKANILAIADKAAYGDCEKSQIFEAVEVSELPNVKEYRLMYMFGAWVCDRRIYAETDVEAVHDADEAYQEAENLHTWHGVALVQGNRFVKMYRPIRMNENGEMVYYNIETVNGENRKVRVSYGDGEKSPICEATEAAKELEAEMMAEAIAHHVRLKEKHPDALLLLRCGDFYELWLSDAEIGADVLRLTLTRRPDGVPICAFPYMALDTYLPKLVRAGHRVAICDDLRTKRRPRHQEATA